MSPAINPETAQPQGNEVVNIEPTDEIQEQLKALAGDLESEGARYLVEGLAQGFRFKAEQKQQMEKLAMNNRLQDCAQMEFESDMQKNPSLSTDEALAIVQQEFAVIGKEIYDSGDKVKNYKDALVPKLLIRDSVTAPVPSAAEELKTTEPATDTKEGSVQEATQEATEGADLSKLPDDGRWHTAKELGSTDSFSFRIGNDKRVQAMNIASEPFTVFVLPQSGSDWISAGEDAGIKDPVTQEAFSRALYEGTGNWSNMILQYPPFNGHEFKIDGKTFMAREKGDPAMTWRFDTQNQTWKNERFSEEKATLDQQPTQEQLAKREQTKGAELARQTQENKNETAGEIQREVADMILSLRSIETQEGKDLFALLNGAHVEEKDGKQMLIGLSGPISGPDMALRLNALLTDKNFGDTGVDANGVIEKLSLLKVQLDQANVTIAEWSGKMNKIYIKSRMDEARIKVKKYEMNEAATLVSMADAAKDLGQWIPARNPNFDVFGVRIDRTIFQGKDGMACVEITQELDPKAEKYGKLSAVKREGETYDPKTDTFVKVPNYDEKYSGSAKGYVYKRETKTWQAA